MRRFLLLALTAALPLGGLHAAKGKGLKPSDRVAADLYVMSLCPFGVQAENGILPVAKALEGFVDLRLHFIASEKEGGGFQALHGQPEVDENIRQLCVRKLSPAKYMDYILERNKDYKSPDWQKAATAVKLDPAAIEKCFSGGEGAKLHAEDIKVGQERKAFGSPTIDIAGKPYQGGRSQRAFAEILCGALKEKGHAPDACKDLSKFPGDAGSGGPMAGCGEPGAAGAAAPAPPVAFDVVILSDKGCAVCGPTLEEVLKRQHPAAKFKTVDAASAEGKALADKHGVQALPFYVLDKGVEKDPNFNTLLDQFYAKSADGYVVKPGGNTFRSQVRFKRARRAGHLDLFVSPLSLFSTQVESEFMRHLKTADLKDITLSFHFIVQEGVKARDVPSGAKGEARAASLKEAKQTPEAGPLLGLRGEAEVQEARRQACLFQHAPVSDFLAYLDCRNQNLNDASRADTCLKPTEAISACIKGGEGDKLLRRDAELVRDLDINTAVAVLWENKYGPFGWHEVDWKKLISK